MPNSHLTLSSYKDFFAEIQKDSTYASLNIKQDYKLAPLCSFKTGGTAQLFAAPSNEQSLQNLLRFAHKYNIPITLIGGGSNVVAPDTALPGLTINTLNITGISIQKDMVSIKAGESVKKAAMHLANAEKSCIEFLYGMPGSIGGALYMNARCYKKEIADVFISARGYTFSGEQWEYMYNKEDFAYKKSPFQNKNWIITECTLATKSMSATTLWKTMLYNENDRRHKGHYIYPCAGSVFKNNYNFGKPSGEILDSLGVKGMSQGNIKISERHANIIVNTNPSGKKNTTKSKDIFLLTQKMKDMVHDTLNIDLEPEIIFLGDTKLWKI